jgi:hypothetical protein
MTHTSIKFAVAVGWLLAIGAAGVLADVTSPSGWILIALGAVGPPVAMLRYWRDPDQTMSESIQKAIR